MSQEFAALPKTRREAKALGANRYFTGEPCCHGHVAPRTTAKYGCVACLRERKRHPRTRDLEKRRSQNRRWYAANREAKSARRRAKYQYKHPKRRTERAAARAAGLLTYLPSEPCARGHVAERYVKNGRCLECQIQSTAEWRRLNQAYHLQQRRDLRLKNVEAERARVRLWKKENPDRTRVLNRNRDARKKGAVGHHAIRDIAAMFAAQSGRCAYCRKSIKKGYHVDHIVALTSGGSNWPNNLQLLCPSCNSRKHARDPLDFARELGLLL